MGGTSADIGVAAGRRSCACATCSTRRSATTRRWCRWSTSTRSAPAAARSPTSTRAASSASARSRRAPIPARPATARGGTEPTSTDAQLLLGRLRPDRGLLGGEMRLDVDLAAAAMADGRRRSSACRVEEAALGALQIQKFGMTQAIELNSVRRGYDPREFTLVAARRRRAAVRLRHRARARDPARARAAPSRDHVGHRPARHRPRSTSSSRRERHCAEDARPRRGSSARFARARGAGRRAARRRRRARATARLVTPPRRLPLRGPGLRGALRRAGRARSTTTGSSELGGGASTARTRREYGQRFDAADRDRQRPRRRHRPRRRASVAARSRRRRRPARAPTLEREVVFEVDGAAPSAARRRSTSASALRAGRPHRGARGHRAVRLDDRRPARARRPRSTATETSSSTARRGRRSEPTAQAPASPRRS